MNRLVDWLRARPRVWAPLALAWALVLGLPALQVGYIIDDHVHRCAFTGLPLPVRGLDLYSFSPKEPGGLAPFVRTGPYPWWTHPELKVRFFRPLSSALLQLDHAVFPEQPLAAHLHSLAWNLLFVGAGLLVLRRLVPSGVGRALAYLLWAAAASRWMAVSWLANRNALVAGAPVLLGFWLHLRWRQDGWRPGAVLSALAYATGLCGAEVGAAFLAYPVAFELTAAGASFRRRALGVAPVLACVCAYAVAYRLTNSGALHSGIYLDPVASPLEYLAVAPGRVLALLGGLTAQLPVDFWLSLPSSRTALSLLSVLAVATVGAGAWRLHREDGPRLRFLVLAILGSLLPAAAVFPMARQVLPASLGGAALFAWLAQWLWRRGRRAPVFALLALHLGLSSLTWLAMPSLVRVIQDKADAAVEGMELERDWSNLRVLVLTTPDPALFLFPPLQRAADLGTTTRAWWILTHGPLALEVRRTGPGALEVDVLNGSICAGDFEQVLRSPKERFAPGDRVALEGGAVEVLAVADGWPTKLRVTLDSGFDAPDLRVLAWRDGTFRRVALPAVGGALRLEPSPGPMSP